MASRTISNVASEILAENTIRKSFVIQNEDSSISVFVKKERPGNNSVSTTDHDHQVGPGAALSVNTLTDGQEAIQARWTIIAASGTPLVSFFETEDFKR